MQNCKGMLSRFKRGAGSAWLAFRATILVTLKTASAAILSSGQNAFVPCNLVFGIHGLAAGAGSTVARRFFSRLGIVDVVVVRQFLSGCDVAQSDNPDALVYLIGVAIGLTGMVDKGCHAEAVDHGLAIVHAEEIGNFAVGVHPIGFFRR